jgi:hypothetical protein
MENKQKKVYISVAELVLADGRSRSSKKEKSKSVGVGENNIF